MRPKRHRWLLGCTLFASAATGVTAFNCGSSSSGSAGPTSGSSTGGTAGDDEGAGDGGASTGSAGSSGSGGSGASSGSGSGSSSSGGTGGDAGSVHDGSTSSGTLCLKPGSGDYAKTGPYSVTSMSVDLASSLPTGTASPTTYVIYYPTTFEANCPAPIAAWGNGTGVDQTQRSVYEFYQTNLASWGVVVIASDNPSVAASPYLKAGLDYLTAQNKASGSVFYGKLGTKAGVAGHSQGGFAATETTSTDTTIVAEVCVEGGGVPRAGVATLCLTGNASVDASAINAVNSDVITMTYPGTTGAAFLADWDGGDHVTTPTLAGWASQNPGTIQFVRLMTAWYRCFLADDGVACGLFRGGTNCGICKDPGWAQLESKNF